MRSSLRLLAAFVAGPLGAIATGTNGCSQNNCLRAVIAEAFTTRHGAKDCSIYLRVTVTPATSTFESTVTVPALVVVSSTVVEGYTDVETIVASTKTEYSEETATIKETLTVTETAATTRTVDLSGNPAKRDVTASGSTFPAYASACTSFAKYTSACSCVGVFPETITASAPSTTVTVTSTSTSTSTRVETTSTTTTSPLSVTDTTLATSTVTITTTDSTTTTTSTATATATNIVKNGRFSSGLAFWTFTRDSQVTAMVVNTNTNPILRSANMYNNNLLEMRQQLAGLQGITYNCRYDWLFSNYYATLYTNGRTYVPYVHIYINNDIVDNSTPEPPKSAGVWYTTEFQFTSSGSDTLWFDCASPQARSGAGGGSNFLSLDNISCVAA